MTGAQGVVLDAGVFIALERRSGTAALVARGLVSSGTPLVTSAAVVAQVWRGGRGRQAAVAALLQRTEVVGLNEAVGKILGLMLGATGASDPVDAHVVFLARERDWPVLTSDPDDILTLDPGLHVERI